MKYMDKENELCRNWAKSQASLDEVIVRVAYRPFLSKPVQVVTLAITAATAAATATLVADSGYPSNPSPDRLGKFSYILRKWRCDEELVWTSNHFVEAWAKS